MTTKRKDHGTAEHPTDSNESERADKTSTTAYEGHEPGEPRSRKSTRKSANAGKPASTLEIREALQKGTPEARHAHGRPERERIPRR
jgi:hypothetical protein